MIRSRFLQVCLTSLPCLQVTISHKQRLKLSHSSLVSTSILLISEAWLREVHQVGLLLAKLPVKVQRFANQIKWL